MNVLTNMNSRNHYPLKSTLIGHQISGKNKMNWRHRADPLSRTLFQQTARHFTTSFLRKQATTTENVGKESTYQMDSFGDMKFITGCRSVRVDKPPCVGCYLCEIFIPQVVGSLISEELTMTSWDKSTDKYPWCDPQTYDRWVSSNHYMDKTQRKILYQFVHWASVNNKVEGLQWWVDFGADLQYTEKVADEASGKGNIAVLDWWLHRSGKPVYYSEKAMFLASKNGEIGALIWWEHCGLKVSYTTDVLVFAADRGHTHVLFWWLRAMFPIKNCINEADWVALGGHALVLAWFNDSHTKTYESTWRNNTIDDKTSLGIQYGPLKWTDPMEEQRFSMLKWFLRSEYFNKYINNSMDTASANGDTTVLNWWFASNLPLSYTKKSMDLASVNGHTKVLDLWVASNFPLKFSRSIAFVVEVRNQWNVVQWWEDSKLDVCLNSKRAMITIE